MKVKILVWFISIIVLYNMTSCSNEGYSNKVKVVKPKWRFTKYNPKIDKRKKRVKTVTYRSH